MIFEANVQLFTWEVIEAAPRALLSIMSEYIPKPQQPRSKGFPPGTMVYTMRAKDQELMRNGEFDVIRIVQKSRRPRAQKSGENGIMLAIQVQE